MTYQEKLLDPRWQKKRLKILNRDDWACQACGDKEETLHVHHITYSKNPWESKNINLITLCKSCHDIWHKVDKLGYDFSSVFSVCDLYNKLEMQSINKSFIDKGEKLIFAEPIFEFRK